MKKKKYIDVKDIFDILIIVILIYFIISTTGYAIWASFISAKLNIENHEEPIQFKILDVIGESVTSWGESFIEQDVAMFFTLPMFVLLLVALGVIVMLPFALPLIFILLFIFKVTSLANLANKHKKRKLRK